MKRNTDLIRVRFDGAWQLAVEDQTFGPYASREDAERTALQWAENAKSQGHTVAVVFDGTSSAERLKAVG